MSDQSTPAPAGISRRLLLGGAAALGSGAAASALPLGIRKALAQPASVAGRFGLGKIKHVVILMQENRSFDHYFGTLSGVRGFSDPTVQKLPNGQSLFYQPDATNPDGYTLPWHADTKTTAAQNLSGTSHSWEVQHKSWDNGAMDGWIETKGNQVMAYLTADDIPFQYALADYFTICDDYHCSVLGETHPNRHMHMTGTIDPNGQNGGPALDNTSAAGRGGFAGYTWITYPEQLEAAGVSWRIYNDNAYYNTMVAFKNFADAQPGDPLYDKGMVVNPGEFEWDCANGTLPTVSWITTLEGSSEHPGEGMIPPAAGAQFAWGKIDAVASNPELWNSTVFILNYDENDGFFDHVPPVVAPPGTPGEYVTVPYSGSGNTLSGYQAVGLGFRVPCIIISPWTVGGYVYSGLSDHTSVLKFLERITGVQATNISDWRRNTVSDLTGAFQSVAKPAPPITVTGDTTTAVSLATYQSANLPPAAPPASGSQQMPRQEPGIRPHVGG